MSYDLFFASKTSLPTRDELKTYFANREHYTIGDFQAFYQNDDTGVYFYFEFDEPSEGEQDSTNISFNLNYFRPHFFGLEAAPEVEAFINSFELNISDPQTDGMGEGPFSIEGFLKGWNAGNRFAYQAILSSEDRPDVFAYSTEGLTKAWKWNYGRNALQEDVGDSLFVPKLMFMKNGLRACTAIVWPDACPIYMPEAELVFVLRKELSTAGAANDDAEITVVRWRQIAPMLSPFTLNCESVPYFELDYDYAPKNIVEFIKSQPISPPENDMGLANDNVYNEELVTEVLGRVSSE